jgi:adenylate cyclase
MSRALKAWAFGALIGLSAAVFGTTSLGVGFEERVGLSWLFEVRGPVDVPDGVAVVALDERTAHTLDLPDDPRDWPRSLHGELIDELTRRGAEVIVFDLSFATAQSAHEDRALAEAIAGSGRVILFEGLERTRRPLVDGRGAIDGWVWLEEVRRPLPLFAEGALGQAPFPLPIVPDRVSQFWTFLPHDRSMPTLPALALHAYARPVHAAWRQLLADAGATVVGRTQLDTPIATPRRNLAETSRLLKLGFDADPGLADRIREIRRRSDVEAGADVEAGRNARLLDALIRLYGPGGNYYLNFYGPPGSVPTVPYHTVIAQARSRAGPAPSDFAGMCVFVGYSETTIPTKIDGFNTVFTSDGGVDLSGVEIGATAFANLLTDDLLEPVHPVIGAGLLVAFALAVGLPAFLLPALWALTTTLAICAAYAVAAQLLFDCARLWLPLATPLLLQAPVALIAGLLAQYGFIRRQRRQVQHALNYYVPERVAQEFADHPVNPILVRETAYATCLATDAEGFTSLSERLGPERTAAFLNAYFAALTAPLLQYRADFREFHADGVMCAWISRDGDVAVRERACLAALGVKEAIDAFNAAQAPVQLGVRIGLHAGEVFLGNVGAGGRFAFRLVGDIVNTASRIEALNKDCRTRLLASETVIAGVDSLLTRPLGEFRLKGRQAPVCVFEILGVRRRSAAVEITLCEKFTAALAEFQHRNWRVAARCFGDILDAFPDDGPARLYLEKSLANLDPPTGDREATVIRPHAEQPARGQAGR